MVKDDLRTLGLFLYLRDFGRSGEATTPRSEVPQASKSGDLNHEGF